MHTHIHAKTHTIKIMHLLRFKCEIFLHPFLFAPTHITFIIKKKIYSLVIDMYIMLYMQCIMWHILLLLLYICEQVIAVSDYAIYYAS